MQHRSRSNSRDGHSSTHAFSRTLSFQLPFYCVLFCGLWSGFMKGIMKGYERLLLWWRATRGVVKCWEYGGKNRWKEFCPFHENTGFTLALLEKDPQNSNSEESSENRDTFSQSKFTLLAGLNLLRWKVSNSKKSLQNSQMLKLCQVMSR